MVGSDLGISFLGGRSTYHLTPFRSQLLGFFFSISNSFGVLVHTFCNQIKTSMASDSLVKLVEKCNIEQAVQFEHTCVHQSKV